MDDMTEDCRRLFQYLRLKDHRELDTDLGIIEFDRLWNRLSFAGSGVDTIPPGGIINMGTV